ncbi:MAG: hypothetical protein NUV57_06090 [archaeon]|nr:hypothetical protein [archaeon]
MNKIYAILKDFYPELTFFKAGVFKLNKKWASDGINIMLFLLKEKKNKDKVLGNELFFNGKDFAQISFGEFKHENLEGLFRTMKGISSKHRILEFKKKENLSIQEKNIIKAFEKVNK